MTDEFDPQAELERLRAMPMHERPQAVEELIERLEQDLEEKSPRPPAKP